MRMAQTHQIPIMVPLAVGAVVVVATIVIHALALFATISLFRHEKRTGRAGKTSMKDFAIVSLVMGFAFVAHVIEIGLWAMLFMICGEFQQFGWAYYHSAVNYTTLGYGDVIMRPAWRMLGPLEAAD